eukprot:277713-Rhodomonas_salina.1
MARLEYHFPGIGKKEWQWFIMRHLTIAPCMNNMEEEDQILFAKVNESLGIMLVTKRVRMSKSIIRTIFSHQRRTNQAYSEVGGRQERVIVQQVYRGKGME